MYPAAVILCTVILNELLFGVSCHLFPPVAFHAVSNLGASKVYKRQNEFLDQCALDRFDDCYQGTRVSFCDRV